MPSACLAISYASRRRPQMSTLSIDPPSVRTTLRNASNDGATVRSSRVGSRMTMISYGRMRTSSPPMVVCGHGRSVAGGSPASATGPGYRTRHYPAKSSATVPVILEREPHRGGGGLGQTAGVKRGFRVVFDHQLARLRPVAPHQQLDQP